MRKKAAGIVLTSLLCACGGGDGVDSPAGAGLTPQSAAPTATPEATPQAASEPTKAGDATTHVAPPKFAKAPTNPDDVRSWIERALNPPVEPRLDQPGSRSGRLAAPGPDVVPANPQQMGAWSSPQSWPLISIHAALLPDGRVLTYGTNANGQQTGRFIYDLWDASAVSQDSGHMTLPNATPTDLFCNAQTVLETTGELFMAGGDNFVNGATTNTGNNNSVLFRPGDNSLRAAADMHRQRWYSSVTALADGQIFVMGGAGGNDRPEVRTREGVFTLLDAADTGNFNYWYPRNFLAPDDRVFGFDIDGRMYIVDARDGGYVQRLANLQSPFMGSGSTPVVYGPGQVLQVGGYSNRTAKISFNRAVPVATETGATSSARFWGTSTVLPDGRVLMTGGSTLDNQLTGVNNSAELWNPTTGTWTVAASGALARLYHSVALLLPDATVLVAGGGAPGPLINTNAERYWPPYLYNAAGALAERPQILSAPDSLTPGQRFSVQTAGSQPVEQVVLVRTGSVTHSFNFDQRRIVLPHQRSGNAVTAQLPSNGATIPPGYYMLFVLDAGGVPSKAQILRVGVGASATVGADWTGTIGGAGGGDFRLECAADEVIAGVHGRVTDVLTAVGPQCVRVGATGQWIGSPRTAPATGGGNGTAFTQTCARNSAVTGLTGRSGAMTDRLQLGCSVLASADRASAGVAMLPAAGGPGGAARAYRSCGLEGVSRALYGRSGSAIDAVGLLCRSEDKANDFPFFTRASTALAGGGGGTRFELLCHSDEVLAGVSGRASGYLDRLSPLCVKIDDRGTWTSDLIGRAARGGDGGAAFTRTCPAQHAVSGISTRAGGYVDSLRLQCRPLASAGRLGAGTVGLPAIGGNGGSPQNPSCSNDRPANGLIGRADRYIDALGLSCRGQV